MVEEQKLQTQLTETEQRLERYQKFEKESKEKEAMEVDDLDDFMSGLSSEKQMDKADVRKCRVCQINTNQITFGSHFFFSIQIIRYILNFILVRITTNKVRYTKSSETHKYCKTNRIATIENGQNRSRYDAK